MYLMLKTTMQRERVVRTATVGNLLDDRVEEAAREPLLDLLLEQEVRSDIGLVRFIGKTCSAGEDADDASIPAHNNRARVTRVGELGVLEARRVVAEDSVFKRILMNAVLWVITSDGFQPIDTTIGGAGRTAILDGKQGLGVVDVVVLGTVEFGLGHHTFDLNKACLGLLVLLTVMKLREHKVCPLDSSFTLACGRRKITVSQRSKEQQRQ